MCCLFLLLVEITGHAQATKIKIVPQPQQLTDLNSEYLLPGRAEVFLDPRCGLSQAYVADRLHEKGIATRFVRQKSKAIIVLTNDAAITGKEGYRLRVVPGNGRTLAELKASCRNGMLYALSTLLQLIERDGVQNKLPGCEIYDYPAFGWRAFMLDEARHFHGTEQVKKLLDEMVQLKMNIFHWHLVDDPGWRLQIKKYPLLTSVGARSNFSFMSRKITPLDTDSLDLSVKWYYTQNEIKDIVRYAAERGITIIPEIEVPGHVSASVYAYPWLGASSKRADTVVAGDLYDVTDPKVEQFLFDVLDEVMALFPGKIVHIGGDEANYAHWQNDPAINAFMKKENIPTYMDLQIWSINRLSKYIASKGARMMGWNEITGDNVREEAHVQKSQSEKLAPGTIVQFWDGAVSLINKSLGQGYDVVNSNRFFTYLDYPYEVTSLEKMYSFNPVPEGVAPADSKKVLGLGAQIWGEYTPTAERLNYQVFPRIGALAEAAWTARENKTGYALFKERLEVLEWRWKELGYIKE